VTPPPDAEVVRALTKILTSAEFQEPLINRVWTAIFSVLERVVRFLAGLGAGTRLALVVGCALLLVVLLVDIVRTFLDAGLRAGRPLPRGSAGVEPPPTSSAEMAARARALAAEGRLRDAARALQEALLIELCARHGLAFQRELTDWEWLERLSADDAVVDFTRRTERLAFGKAAPDPAGFADCDHRFMALVGAAA
jgi:hypothetical protein